MSSQPPNEILAGAQAASAARDIGVLPAGAVPTDAVSDVINLPTGKELDELSATKLAASKPVRLVVVAGPVGCGKTTLLTSLYELFQHGPVADYFFAGSNSLPAFERRCYFSRTSSERSVADTERTLFGDVRYLHLQIFQNNDPQHNLDLLFTDVSGEAFEHARDSTVECQLLTFLRRADHFLLLLDSEKLVRKEKRWGVVNDSKTLLRSCLDSGMLRSTCVVNVLWTKFDYFKAVWSKEHEQFLGKIKSEFETEFGSRVNKLFFSEIAARPTHVNKLSFGHGLPELLKNWATICQRECSMHLFPEEVQGSRESELFASRHFAEHGKIK